MSPIGRLLLASIAGMIAAAIVLGIAARLDSAFFDEKPRMESVPCYFTAPDQTVANKRPGAVETATGCLPAPAEGSGVAGFFSRMMGKSGQNPRALRLEPPPASDRRP